MSDFVGRRGYMTALEAELDGVRGTGRGRFVSMRGRRRVGKSRLVDEFLRRGARPPVPYVFFTASRQPLSCRGPDVAFVPEDLLDVWNRRSLAF